MSHDDAANDAGKFKILDHVPMGVVVLDADYHVVFWNKCLEYWTGLHQEVILGQNIRDRYPLFSEKRFTSRIASVFRGGPPIIFSSHIHKYLIPSKLPDGSHRLQHVTISPMRRADGTYLAMAMIQDVTEVNTRLIQRKQAEEELRRVLAQLEAANAKLEESNARAVHMAREAQEANAAKSIFLANMSHEIRTPMSGILGALEMLSSRERDPAQRHLLRMTSDSATSLLQIINDILDLSKVEAGKMELRPEDVSLEVIMGRCRDLYSFPARAKNLDLRLELGPGLPHVLHIDPTRLEQVLRNLLDNAVKFTARGWIHFGVERADTPELGPALRFQVRDSGIGITATSLERLFQPFSQADSSYAKTHGGTGLGLALCRRLVELMGGTLTVRSTPGQGSCFAFLIPLCDPLSVPSTLPPGADAPTTSRHQPVSIPPVPTTAGHVRPEASPAPSFPKHPEYLEYQGTVRVLVAEDVELNQQYLGFLLERLGYRFEIVSSGLGAVNAFQNASWDVILMDIQMPEMDGLEATDRIRRLEREQELPHTPIIALTAYAMPEEQQDFLARGMDGFSPKPIDSDQLHGEILRVLSTRPSESSSGIIPDATKTAHSAAAMSLALESTSPVATSPIFNLQDVQVRFMGNHALWSKMVARFFQEEFPNYLEQLRDLAHTPDLQETARLAHKLKGALGTLCADPVRNASMLLEKAAKSGDALETENGLHILLEQLLRMPAGFEATHAYQGDAHEGS